VGAGLTGCTLAWRLAREGVSTLLLEREAVPGGLVRSARLEGVVYEPHGSHVFHTDDDEIWELATAIVPFRPYRHRVRIMIEGRLLNWPILVSDIDAQSRSEEIRAELAERRHVDAQRRAQSADFEAWCLELMGPILYDRYVRPYTEKQWGRPARELPAAWAPGRVQVRWDDDPYLFGDRHQGWPAGGNGYSDLVDGLLDHRLIALRTGAEATLETLAGAAADAHTVVVTAPLDAVCGEALGALEWRGIAVRSIHLPHVELAQPAMVVNYPAAEYPFIRIHETKHASGQRCAGTVLSLEFPGASARHYPVPTERNRALNDRYRALVADRLAPTPTFFCGRLAGYRYLDMDDCMREALDTAAEVLAAA
jgi:UDP-galactopyranose mutase